MPVVERGRRPDYEIKALNKDTQERGPIGAGWLNEDGSIYLKFNPFVVLPVGAHMAITAFATEEDGPFERPTGRGEISADEAHEELRQRSPRRSPRRRPARR